MAEDFKKITEQNSYYNDLEQKSVSELTKIINKEDQTVANAVEKSLSQIETLIKEVVKQVSSGGRLFYIGAGTSGRLGILDASECPPTFGVSDDVVIGLIAGGDQAIRKAVEFAEDNTELGWQDLQAYNIHKGDIVIGIVASGTTPYVLGAIEHCKSHNIPTGCITCNPKSPLAKAVDFPIEVVVGPEVVTGSSRMKAGTAQKMILNMISTALMIKLGRVEGHKMVDMQLSNHKLVNRGVQMIREALKVSEAKAKQLLNQHKSVRQAIANGQKTHQ
ncbi:N-acetylmuramic acid 6-phosphate etherase [Flavobacterium sp. CS20]|uniref:N-acetylmuramic acid 6-phosphate etherase n=1 Tax=Flavobacterium sp. CS20 TaxID=2775246 RepID=UPI001B3A2102|nr:N-acetylmuramic acid 6-phosphate etherase [Flavobacterium sp. CS20]QTY25928.1 N-acetylmuramic acid 6-phosphate etherase [Flavobacterium sp. CS20]